MTIRILESAGTVKHGVLQFHPGTKVDFADDGVEDYFVKCGWAEFVDEEANATYEKGEVTYVDTEGNEVAGVDPETRHNESGLLVRDIVVSTQVKEG